MDEFTNGSNGESIGSFMDGLDLSDAQELTTKPDGSEVVVRIINAEMKKSKAGENWVQVRLDIPDEPFTKDIYTGLFFPQGQDAKKDNIRKLALKRFGECFNIDFSQGQNLEDWKGLTAWAILSEKDDGQYGTKNEVKKWISPA